MVFRLSVSCGYEDDVSSGCCLFVQLRSSSHTYIAENVHDNNLCLYSFYNASGGSATPWERLLPIVVSKLFYTRDTYFLYSVYFILLIVHSIKNPKISLLQNTHFILLLRMLFSITFRYLDQRVLRLRPIAICGINTLILKLATNDLCTCSHQAILRRRCRGA